MPLFGIKWAWSRFANICGLKYKSLNVKDIYGAYSKDPLYKNSFLLIIINILNAVSSFVFWIFAARIYLVEDVGLATALMSSVGLIITFSRLGFDYSIIRFFPISDKAKVFNTSLGVTTVFSLIAGTAYILMIEYFSPSLEFLKKPGYALLFLLIAASESIASIAGRAFIADRMVINYLIQNIILIIRIVFLALLASYGSLGIVSSVGLAYLVASAFSMLTLAGQYNGIRIGFDIEFINESLKFSFWNYISSLLSLTPTMILPIMILNLLGETEAAKYYITFAIANFILIIPNAAGTSLFVEVSHGNNLRKNVIQAVLISFALIIPSLLFFYVFGEDLLRMLGSDYSDAFCLLEILALSSFPAVFYYLSIPIRNAMMDTDSIVKLNLIRFLLLLGLSHILIVNYGIIGAGYGWLISHCILALFIIWISKKNRWL